jgi:hypothetical protein
MGRRKDDNYIALRDVDTGEYLINGGFVVSMFSKTIQVRFGTAYTVQCTCTDEQAPTPPNMGLQRDVVCLC